MNVDAGRREYSSSCVISCFADWEIRLLRYVKLTKNYRSHEAILQYPNEKFYDGELEVCGLPSSINAFLNSRQLVSPKYPVVFHAISGRNEREASSPSYFNIDEAIQVKAYVAALLQDKRHPVRKSLSCMSRVTCSMSHFQTRRTSA